MPADVASLLEVSDATEGVEVEPLSHLCNKAPITRPGSKRNDMPLFGSNSGCLFELLDTMFTCFGATAELVLSVHKSRSNARHSSASHNSANTSQAFSSVYVLAGAILSQRCHSIRNVHHLLSVKATPHMCHKSASCILGVEQELNTIAIEGYLHSLQTLLL